MENSKLSKYTVSFGLSLAICSVVNALIVVVKEKSPALQAEMKKLTGSHWITHASIVLILFFLLGWLFAATKKEGSQTMPAHRLIQTMVGGVLIAGLIIVGFYLVAD